MRRHQPLALSLIGEMGLDAFCEQYHVKANRADGLISLKYDQIARHEWHPATRECRGMVVREDDPTHLVAMPYTKFFNLGEQWAPPIDWGTARVLEKLDGSLMILYYDWRLKDWAVATSGHPTAGGSYNGFGDTFRDVFWRTWAELAYELPRRPLHPMDDVWYLFELCRPDNRIVVRYDQPRLVLHGARRRAGLMELTDGELHAHAVHRNWEVVEEWNPPSWRKHDTRDFVVNLAGETDPMYLEGFVVVDSQFRRVKVKNPAYVEIHHLRGNGVRSPRAVVECIKAGEVDEILAHFPEMRDQFDPVIASIEDAVRRIHGAFHLYSTLSRKDYAAQVKEMPFSNAAFRALGHDPEEVDREFVRSLILSMNTPAILRALDMEVEETPPADDRGD